MIDAFQSRPREHYDVVFVGSSLAAELAAVWLGAMGLRVLVIRHRTPASTYQAGPYPLPRAPFSIPGGRIWSELVHALGIGPAIKQKVVAPSPPLQVVMREHRLDLDGGNLVTTNTSQKAHGQVSGLDAWLPELSREFDDRRNAIEALHAKIKATTPRLDALLLGDLSWPPRGFLGERRTTALVHGAGLDELTELSSLRDFPTRHGFRQHWAQVIRFATHSAVECVPTAWQARAYADLAEGGAVTFAGGYAEFEQLLRERGKTLGVQWSDDETVESALVRKGRIEGLVLHSGRHISTEAIVVGADRNPLRRLLSRTGGELEDQQNGKTELFRKFTLNLVVESEGLPEGLGSQIAWAPARSRQRQTVSTMILQRQALDDPGRELLVCEALLSQATLEELPSLVNNLREHVLGLVGQLLPFIGSKIVLVDSPHDTRPIQLLAERQELPPLHPWSRGAQSMETLSRYRQLELGQLRAPAPNDAWEGVFHCHGGVAPGLGVSGELFAARALAFEMARVHKRKVTLGSAQWIRRPST